MKQIKAKVISNRKILGKFERDGAGTFKRPEARNIQGSYLMWLSCPEILGEEPRPGQFIMARCGDYVLPRPISIHQTNSEGIALFYTVWENGKGTQWLSQRKRSKSVEIFGPLGNSFTISPESRHLLLVAGGTGMAPLCFLARYAVRQENSVTLLYGYSDEPSPSNVKNSSQKYPWGKMLPPQVNVISIKSIFHGIDKPATKVVRELIPDHIDWADQVFACGPMPMYRDMWLKKKELKLEGKPVQVSLEVRMGCGTGVCYGCTIKTRKGLKQVCTDGPIFDLDDILWDELDYL